MRRTLLILLLVTGLLAEARVFAQSVKITSDERKIAEAITANQLSSYLHFVASDAMGGRDTPSQGLDVTAEFLKMNLERWGFKPAGDNGTFFQKIELSRDVLDADKAKLQIGSQEYKLGDDFLRLTGSGSVNAPLVFAKDGWMVKSKGIDALSGVDVTGKIVVITTPGIGRSVSPRPTGVTQDDLKGPAGEEWADPVTYAAKKGAVGVIVIAPAQANWAGMRNFMGRGGMTPEKLRAVPSGGGQAIPVMVVTKSVGDALFTGETANASSTSAFVLNRSANLSLVTRKDSVWTQNVVARWEGSDPVLKNEMVAVGAHYDHVGTNPNAPGADKIWNGADDDGSGTVAVLGIAEALAQSKVRPKRSVLFVWHCGEEKGLWGSEYYSEHPIFPIEKTSVDLNIDMIGRIDPNRKTGDSTNYVYVVGDDKLSSDLKPISESINKKYSKLELDYKYNDPKDPTRIYYRSDHYNFARKGIPIIFYFHGIHNDYHQPSDTPDKINYDIMEKRARFVFYTAWEMANRNDMLKRDIALPIGTR